jgi:TonB-linked SusC/RagA family outer membrane protein
MIISLLLLTFDVSAQTKTVITGNIVSKSDGQPMVGVTIAEKDQSNRIITGVITDFNGNYVIKVTDPGNTLAFSFIGYETQELIPGKKQKMNIELVESYSKLDEVTVFADKKVNTGEFNMDKSRISTAIQTISAKDVSDVSSSSMVDQLQGRLSGVDIVANSGEPGAGMSIRIRGTSSLNASSEPLIVINGVPFETEVDDSFDFGTADEEEYSSLIGVSSDDIEEISVLKDAAATAQYGSRGANGVLLIKTKRGAKGKARFSYSYKGNIGVQPSGMPLLNGDQYSTLMKDINLTRGKSAEDYSEINYDPTYELYDYYNNNTDWIDEITQVGYSNQHNFSVSGGGDKAFYRISASAKTEDGTTVGTGSDVYTTRAILDYNISDKLKISTELSYSHGSVDKSYTSKIDGTTTNIRGLALLKMPNQSIYEMDQYGNEMNSYFTPISNIQGDGDVYYNPVAMANLATYNIENNRITPVFKIEYKPISTLSYFGTLSYDTNNDKTTRFTPEAAIGDYWTSSSNNYCYLKDSEFFVLSTENKVVWEPKLGEDHSIFLGGIFSTYDKTSQTYEVSTSNTPGSSLESVIVDADISNNGSLSSDYSRYRSVGWNIMFNYMFKDRYILGGSTRCEGNSRFGDNFRYGVFPSLSGRWIVSKERFMEPVKFVNEFSLRASYGSNGNSPSFNYGAYNIYSNYSYDYIDVRPSYPSTIELEGLKWETVVQQNIGFNLVMLNHRVNADVEFYLKETRDMLNKNTTIPTTSGFSKLSYVNMGDMENRGWEISVMGKVVNKKDFKIDINFNLSRNKNVITKVEEGMDVESGDPLVTGSDGYLKRIQEDNPIGSFYGYHALGVYSTSEDLYAKDADGNVIYDISGEPKMMMFNNSYSFAAGDAQYEDMNHDGNINRLDVVYLGNANPLLYGGFGPNITYKNIQFNAFFNFRYKQEVINIARLNAESLDDWDNQSTAALRRWRSEGDVTDVPRAYYGSQVNTLGSDRFLEDASFLRLKYLTLRYNFSKNVISRLGLTKLSIYATGSNLLTFTNYVGSDPETGSSDDWEELGYDTNKTPRSKQITLGINVQF